MQPDSQQLQQFIDAGKAKGASDEFLAAVLTRRGWPADQVYGALGDYWQQVTGVVVPERTVGGGSSRDAFLYLLSFSTLAIWATALGSMLFQFINHWLPDAVSHGSFYQQDLRLAITWQMASIAVAFPIYLVVMRFIFSEVVNNPERLESGVRKWLTWLALLLTAGGVIGDLIGFLRYFLTGELTLRFVLKCFVVLVLCGAIFAWYLGSLRWTRLTSAAELRPRARVFVGGATLAVAVIFLIGLGVAGTPGTQRRYEADSRRVQDLRLTAQRIYAGGSNQPALKDPETGAPYDYRELDGTSYELCATFHYPSPEGSRDFWTHGAGRTCFRLDSQKAVTW